MLTIFARAQSSDPRLAELQQRLKQFYRGNEAYYDYAENDKSFIYEPILRHIKSRRASNAARVRILELGAGRTAFPAFIRQQKFENNIEYLAHDIDDTNADFYRQNKIDFIVGDFPEIAKRGTFDLCFSTYVFEHLVAPHRFLQGMKEVLNPGGAIIIVCPKYGFPGYIPPAIRWLPWWRQQLLTLFLFASGIATRLTRAPKFWICADPAVFKRPWRRDYDAVHMVSRNDVRAALRDSFDVRSFPLQRSTLKMRLLDNIITLSIIAQRRVTAP